MTKVVYNGDWGGYNLHKWMVDRYNELAGTDYKDEWDMKHVPRHDKFLVQAVEEFLVDRAKETDLCIIAIKGDCYRIEEYDGWETVIEPEDQVWIVVE